MFTVVAWTGDRISDTQWQPPIRLAWCSAEAKENVALAQLWEQRRRAACWIQKAEACYQVVAFHSVGGGSLTEYVAHVVLWVWAMKSGIQSQRLPIEVTSHIVCPFCQGPGAPDASC